MPTITYMCWNLHDFGDASARYRGDYQPVANFIAAVARKMQVDIFSLVELNANGVAQLNKVRQALNAAYLPAQRHWHYDWIKGGYKLDVQFPPPPPPANSTFVNQDQLAWSLFANSEGYAVFWNNLPGAASKFAMLPAATRQSGGSTGVPQGTGVDANAAGVVVAGAAPPGGMTNVLQLVGEGRPPTFAAGWFTAPNFTPGAPYVFGDLNFPYTFSPKLNQTSSRRAAYCVINLNIAGTAQQRRVPIQCYHAPATLSIGAPAGTQVSGFAKPLYQIPDGAGGQITPDRALASGDFNVDQNDDGGMGIAYRSYTNPFATPTAGEGGANMQAFIHGDNANLLTTSVQLNQGVVGPPIPQTAPMADFIRYAIDNVFYRGFAATSDPIPGPRFNLLRAVMSDGSLTGRPVSGFLPLLNANTGRGTRWVDDEPMVRNPRGGGYVKMYPSILNWRLFYDGVRAGQFKSTRQAAEFIRLFVSDHLPVAIRFTV